MTRPHLRDVSSAQLAERAHELAPETLKRARHVVTENERTLQAADALEAGDLKLMGKVRVLGGGMSGVGGEGRGKRELYVA